MSFSDDFIDCRSVLEQLYLYLDRELPDGDDVRRIASHLADCAPCMNEHDVEQQIRILVRRCWPRESAPADLRVRIITSITTTRIVET